MKRALFTSKNLIGDAMYISPALRVWHQQHPDYEIDLLTLDDHVTRLYLGMGVPIARVLFQEPDGGLKGDQYDYSEHRAYHFEHVFDVNQAFQLSDQKKQHVAESYADLLGVELDKKPDMSHVGPFYDPPVEQTIQDYEMGLILVSMFSASCSSRGNPPGPANKMLPWFKWKPILKTIRKAFPQTPIRILGAPTDRAPEEMWRVWVQELGDVEYMTGIPLDRLAKIMRAALFLVTIDNGMSHVAASQKTREFVFYPRALGTHYILPKGNPNMRYLHMSPLTLNPVEVIWQLQQAWKEWRLV